VDRHDIVSVLFISFSCPSNYNGTRCEIFIPTVPPVDRDVSSTISPTTKEANCEPLTIPLCQGLEYNHTIFPNMLNHTSQAEAALEVLQFTPLVAAGCSKDFALFLCSVYAPVCTVFKTLVPPCRSLCDNAKDRCELLMTSYGFAWPESLSCDRFPKLGDAICISKNTTSRATPQPPTTKNGECYTYLIKVLKNRKNHYIFAPIRKESFSSI